MIQQSRQKALRFYYPYIYFAFGSVCVAYSARSIGIKAVRLAFKNIYLQREIGCNENLDTDANATTHFHQKTKNQRVYKTPSKCKCKWIKVDKRECLKNPSHELKISFCLGFL